MKVTAALYCAVALSSLADSSPISGLASVSLAKVNVTGHAVPSEFSNNLKHRLGLRSIVSPRRTQYPKAGDAVWQADLARGCSLLQMMAATDEEAAMMFTPPLGGSAKSDLRKYPGKSNDIALDTLPE
jgi:hypothetical protein